MLTSLLFVLVAAEPVPVDVTPPPVEDVAPALPEATEPPVEVPRPVETPVEAPPTPTPPTTTPEPPKPTEPTEPPKEEPRWWQASLRLHGDARLGVTAGNVLLVPFVVPGPAAGGQFEAQFVVFEHVTVGADIAASFGLATDRSDPAPLAGYRGRVRFGLLADADRLVLAVDLHAGVSSVALLPLPKVGISGAATFRLVHTEYVSWDLKADADADVIIIAPAPGLGVSSGVTVRFGGFESGVRVGVDADAVVAVVVNTAGAAAYVDVFAGARF